MKTVARYVLVLIGSMAAGTAGVAAQAAEVIVGASVALTGKYARPGQEQLQGIQLWVEEVNAGGGLLGRKVVLKYYDDESRPETGAKLYERLITDDKADLLIGPYSSDVTLTAGAVAEKHGVPMISAGAASSEIWARGHKNTFGLYTLADIYMDPVLELGKARGLKKIALVYESTSFPRDVAKGVRNKARELGMKLVFDEEYSKAATDFTSTIVKIKAKKPDMIIGGSYLADSTAFMRQAKKNRLYAKIIAFTVGPGLPDFGKNLGLDAEGVMGSSQWEPTLAMPGAKEFAAKYKIKFGYEPGYHAGGGYGAGQVLEAAVKKAGTFDRDKLRKALFELDTVTAFGRFNVDAAGKQIGKPIYAVQWIDGERHVVLPAAAATHKPGYPFKDWAKR